MLNHRQHMENINQRKLMESNIEVKEDCWLDYAKEALKPVNRKVSDALFKIAGNMEHDLQGALLLKKMKVDIMVIGGIANNTYIKHDDTVDLLILFKGYPKSENPNIAIQEPRLEDILLLRDYTKNYLENKFPEADLDDSLPLALEISIESSPCNFCYYFGYEHIKPSEAFGNFTPLSTVKILNHNSLEFESFNPLMVESEFNNKNNNTRGNTKPLIRLLKNLKADSINPITLTGHQISSVVYSMEDYTLEKPPGQLLFLLLEVSLFLKKIMDNPFTRKGLKSADDNFLVETEHEYSFLHGINHLKIEVDSLIKHLISEIDLYTDIYNTETINHKYN